MKINMFFLAIMLAYMAVLITYGILSAKRKGVKDSSDYALGGGGLTLDLALGTFIATFISGATVIGGAGYSSKFGWGWITYVALGVGIGIAVMQFAAGRLRSVKGSTLPQMLESMYGSRWLRILTAIIVVFTVSVTLIVQLLSSGWILEEVVGVPKAAGIIVVTLAFLAYTTYGGLTSVARTDRLQLFVIVIGLALSVIAILRVVPSSIFLSPPHDSAFTGLTTTWPKFLAGTLVYALGVPVQAAYIQRISACKDLRTARRMMSWGAIVVQLIYVMVMLIGIAAGALGGTGLGDRAYPYLAMNHLGPAVGVIVTVTILAGIVTTVDSLLNVIGVYAGLDIYAMLLKRNPDEKEKLRLSRMWTLILGLVTGGITLWMTMRPLPLVITLASFSWGVMACSAFVPFYLGLYLKQRSREAAFLSMLSGFVVAIVGRMLLSRGLLKVNEVLIGVPVSLVVYVVVHALKRGSSVGGSTSQVKA